MKGSGEQTGDGLVEGSTPNKKREQREQRIDEGGIENREGDEQFETVVYEPVQIAFYPVHHVWLGEMSLGCLFLPVTLTSNLWLKKQKHVSVIPLITCVLAVALPWSDWPEGNLTYWPLLEFGVQSRLDSQPGARKQVEGREEWTMRLRWGKGIHGNEWSCSHLSMNCDCPLWSRIQAWREVWHCMSVLNDTWPGWGFFLLLIVYPKKCKASEEGNQKNQ